MGDWWIDEEPWPGPAYHRSLKEIADIFIEKVGALGWAVGVSTDTAGDILKRAFRDFQDSYALMRPQLKPPPHIAGQCCFDGTAKEKREHALWLVKNRNTGPVPRLHFDLNRRKFPDAR